jgi:hypothetical protein
VDLHLINISVVYPTKIIFQIRLGNNFWLAFKKYLRLNLIFLVGEDYLFLSLRVIVFVLIAGLGHGILRL